MHLHFLQLAIGGGGGNIGKSINFGGGDGGDDDGDDDDYFDEFDDGDEGDDGGLFRRRIILPEVVKLILNRKYYFLLALNYIVTYYICLFILPAI